MSRRENFGMSENEENGREDYLSSQENLGDAPFAPPSAPLPFFRGERPKTAVLTAHELVRQSVTKERGDALRSAPPPPGQREGMVRRDARDNVPPQIEPQWRSERKL